MKMSPTSATCRRPPGAPGLVLGVAAALMLGCASPQVSRPPPALQHHGPVVEVDDVDVLAVSPGMEAFLARYVLPYNDPDMRLNLLIMAVTDPGVLGFHYQDDRTLTAAEAFDSRSGNCIGFANLLIAMARRAGLEAGYQEVSLEPEWSSQGDTLLVAKHINVVVRSRNRAFMVDTSGQKFKPDDRRRFMNDREARALYYSNLGAEALLDNELHRAYAYLTRAIETAPRMPDPWNNLGVVYARNLQMREAEQMFLTAHAIDGKEYSALANLYELYMAGGDLASASRLEKKVENYRARNPYYLLKMSEDALAETRYEESFDLLERAIEMKDDEHLFHFALARTQYLTGKTVAAEISLDRARALAPENRLADYTRPLHELVEEE